MRKNYRARPTDDGNGIPHAGPEGTTPAPKRAATAMQVKVTRDGADVLTDGRPPVME